jgi:hypothetical protein
MTISKRPPELFIFAAFSKTTVQEFGVTMNCIAVVENKGRRLFGLNRRTMGGFDTLTHSNRC